MPPRQVIKLSDLASLDQLHRAKKAVAVPALEVDLEASPLHDAIRAYVNNLV